MIINYNIHELIITTMRISGSHLHYDNLTIYSNLKI